MKPATLRDYIAVMHSAIPWDFVFILAILAVVVPWRGYIRVRQLLKRESLSTADRLVLYGTTIAFQWIATAFVLWRWNAHGYLPTALGIAIPRPWLTLGVALGLTALVTVNQLAGIRKLASMPREKQGFFRALTLKLMPHNTTERLAFFALVVTVAICEEILYRGWVQAIFQNAFGGSVVLGIFISAAFFSLAHLYQGRRGLVATFIAGAVFSIVRAWTGSLVPPMAAHFAADLAAGMLAPVWIKAGEAAASGESAKATSSVQP